MKKFEKYYFLKYSTLDIGSINVIILGIYLSEEIEKQTTKNQFLPTKMCFLNITCQVSGWVDGVFGIKPM